MKILQALALTLPLALSGVGFALAQQAPVPRPMPLFQAPVAASGPEVSGPQTSGPEAGEPDANPEAGFFAPAETATQALATVTAEPVPVTLTAMITDGGRTIGEGLVWRIFSTRTDAAGQLELAAKSDSAVAEVQLVPGDYVVHVAYGRAQASDTITVSDAATSKSMVLEAGGLRLGAAITGDIAIPINLLHFDVFTSGSSDADRTIIAQNLGASDILTVNAGTYHIVSYFGSVNAVVRADLRVEPGQLTEATLYHRAAQTAFRLASDPGGEAIADVDWTVKTADGTTVFTDTGAFPTAVLQEGEYVVLAKRGDAVYNRAFEVHPGQPVDVEVLTKVL